MKLNELTITQALGLLDKKEITSADLTEACLKRIEETEPKINALVSVAGDTAMQQAKAVDKKRAAGEDTGRLAGIPVIIKDCICTKDVKSTASSNMLNNYVPVYDAHVIEKLKKAEYVLVAKANMDEFAMGSSTENSHFGPTKNPWDLSRVPGGSSGGSAAAVTADEAIFALGSDTGGSVRQPAGFCGVVGVKPTYGTVSRYGLMAFASSLDQIGPLTKTVEDAAIVMNVVSGRDKRDSTSAIMQYPDYEKDIKKDIKGMRVGVPKEYLEQEMSDDVRKVFDDALRLYKDLGAVVETTSLPTFDYALSAYYIISSAEVSSNLARFDGIRYGYRTKDYTDLKEMYKKTRSEGFGDEVKRRIMLGNYVLSSGYYDAYYLKALKVRTLIKNDFEQQFKKYDFLLSPVTPTPAFKIGEKSTPMDMYVSDLFTVPVNIAGMSAISVPAGLSGDGLPINIQVITNAFCENTMFRAAYHFEQSAGFTAKPAL
jgi:aspartyl-tRNA(Asn)/glutamyl-tRNA(Gln) amidotransferase subunit A